MNRYTVAFSPCPNDTFMFHELVSQRANGGREPGTWGVEVHVEDVETLNRMALRGTFDVSKLSFHAWLLAKDKYALLNAGFAMGFGCGPVVVTNRDIRPHDLASCRIAVPGELTTAHLLLRLFAPEAQTKTFLRYDLIMDALIKGEVDCGVIIHETRFVFERQGLRKLVDLGEWWEERTGLPIPLGGVCVRTDAPPGFAEEFDAALTDSIEAARRNPAPALAYAATLALETDEEVLRNHIKTFVNDFSVGRSEVSKQAIVKLEQMSLEAGLIP